MSVLKEIKNWKVIFGGEEHTGWLPAGATKPLPTLIQEIVLNITIEHDEPGYLLCYKSKDGDIYGDTWYETLEDAESGASEYFGINPDDWKCLI
jgi:hypothetical protein